MGKNSKAVNMATLRAVVAGYLVYLGGSLIYDLLKGQSSMSSAVAWALGLLFIAAGLGYGLYIWKRWRADSSEAASEGNGAGE
jgi:hypothetical protein